MSDEFQFQLSVSLPPSEQYAKGDMVNVRGKDAGEFLQNLLNFDEHMAAEAGKVAANIRAQFGVARDLGGQVIERDQGTAQAPPQNAPSAPQNPAQAQGGPDYQQQPPPAQGAPQGYQPHPQAPQQQPQAPQQPSGPPPNIGPPPSCSHGVKQYLSKPYKNGKPGFWQAWACPADRGDQTQHQLEFIDQR